MNVKKTGIYGCCSKVNSCHLIFLISFFLCSLRASYAQVPDADSKGAPRVIHYTKKEFNGDTQFWAMCQDRDGILYFGNNDGALIFDGERWQTLKLPNKSSIRSLKISAAGVVYAGGFNEFGIIKKDDFGQYQYESLMGLLRTEDRNIENIWQIHEVQGHMVFRSFKMLIAVANNKAVTLPTSTIFNYSTVIDDVLFVQDNEGLKSLDLHSLEFAMVYNKNDLRGEVLLSLLPGFHKPNVLAITKQGSVFNVDVTKHQAILWQKFFPENSNNLITCALKSTAGKYYLGTLRTQVLMLTLNQDKLSVRNAFPSLQDNTVLNLVESNEGNIWALLNNGLDCIDITSPVSTLFENASIYDAMPVGNTMYLATNQGVLLCNDVKQNNHALLKFESMAGLEGQAWMLQQFEGQILCSHDRGLYVLNKNAFKRIPGAEGVWCVIAIKGKAGYYLACAYDGLYLLHYTHDSGFAIEQKLEGFNESSRDILQSDEPGIFWVCHGYKGVFRIKIESSFKRVVSLEHFKDKNGLPSAFNVNVFRWKNEIIFTTNHGVYTYNERTNKFEPEIFLAQNKTCANFFNMPTRRGLPMIMKWGIS